MTQNVPIRPGPQDGDGYAHALVNRPVPVEPAAGLTQNDRVLAAEPAPAYQAAAGLPLGVSGSLGAPTPRDADQCASALDAQADRLSPGSRSASQLFPTIADQRPRMFDQETA